MELLTTAGFTKGNYGAWLNKIMESSPSEWVAIFDHDIFLADKNWYDKILRNIERAPDGGLFTCVTNRIGNPEQKVAGLNRNNHDLVYHFAVAQEQDGKALKEATRPISGVIMVTSKTAWEAAGGFRESGVIGVDNDYHGRILRAGYKVYIMQDLYVYHYYRANLR